MNQEALNPLEPPPQPAGLLDRWINVFAAPGELFESLRFTPVSTANWLLSLLVFIVVSWICTAVFFSQDWARQQMQDMQMQAMEKRFENSQMTEQQKEQVRTQSSRMMMLSAQIAAYAGPFFIAFIGCFAWALYFWLVGVKILKGDFTFFKGVEIVGLTAVVSALGAAIKTLLVMITGNMMASLGPSMLLKPYDPTNPLHNVLVAVDVFTLWVLVLKALGLARLTGRSFAPAAAWIFGGWLVWNGGMLLLGLLIRSMMPS